MTEEKKRDHARNEEDRLRSPVDFDDEAVIDFLAIVMAMLRDEDIKPTIQLDVAKANPDARRRIEQIESCISTAPYALHSWDLIALAVKAYRAEWLRKWESVSPEETIHSEIASIREAKLRGVEDAARSMRQWLENDDASFASYDGDCIEDMWTLTKHAELQIRRRRNS